MKSMRFLVSLSLAACACLGQQPNSAAGYMTVNGVGTSTSTGPLTASIAPPQTVTLNFGGAANTPFTLFNADPSLGGFIAAGGVPTPFGLVDIAPLAFPPISIVLDGINNQGNIIGAIATTGTTGLRSLQATLLASAGCSTAGQSLANLQTLFLPPTAPSFVLSAAVSLVVPPAPLPNLAPVSVSNCDDCYTQIALSNCNAFTFFGVTRNQLFIGSNGYITFDAGDSNLGENQVGFNIGGPRIALFWDDLYPLNPATLTRFDDGSSLTVSWANCPEFAVSNQNTFSMNLNFATGAITMTYGAVAAQDGMCGITPGNSLASTVTAFGPGTPTGDILSRLGGNAYVGGAMESLSQIWTPPGTTFNLAGQTVNFLPTSPGNTAYTLY